MKNIKLLLVLVLMVTGMLTAGKAQAQADVPGEILTAIRSGSASNLAKYFNTTVDIGLDGNKSSYSKTQAEFVLKSFFAKNAPVNVDFAHQGKSDGGQRFAMGTYNSKSGPYRIYVVVKQSNGVLVIDTIDLNKK